MAGPSPNPLIDLPDELRGERVRLRPWRDGDAAAFFALVEQSREHIRRWLTWPDEYHAVDDARAYLQTEAARWASRDNFVMGLFDREAHLLGSVGLHPRNWRVPSFEIGYWIGQAHEGRGYVTDGVRLVTGFAFEHLGAQRVFIQCDALNDRSANVARRCGYVFEGILRSEHREPDGRLRDTLLFSRIPSDPAVRPS
jgi:RimJ/RimL family protein N-acetyltransferase